MKEELSVEEIKRNLFKGKERWASFLDNALLSYTRIVISCLILNDIELVGYKFYRCDFIAADLNKIDLDRASFIDCSFQGCNLKYLSLVNTTFKNISFDNFKISNATLRNSFCSKIYIYKSNVDSFNIYQCEMNNITIENSSLSTEKIVDTKIKMCQKKDSELFNIEIENCIVKSINSINDKYNNIIIKHTNIDNSYFQSGEINDSRFEGLIMESCKITFFDFQNIKVENSSFIKGYLERINLLELCLEKIGLLKTSIVDCEWPDQIYNVSFFGKYIKPEHLLKQPVEDIMGVSPEMRSIIKKSQLVGEKIKHCKKWYSKLWMRFWGFTTAYGDSLLRLTLICLFVILVLFLLFGLESIFFTKNYSFEYAEKSLKIVFFNFVGITGLEGENINNFQKVIILIDRLLGIVFMGLWIGVATNKLSSQI